MSEESVPAIMAPPRGRDNRWTRCAGIAGMAFLGAMLVLCLGSLLVTLSGSRRDTSIQPCKRVAWYKDGNPKEAYLPPFGMRPGPMEIRNLNRTVPQETVDRLAEELGIPAGELVDAVEGPGYEALREHWFKSEHPGVHYALGTDALGRSLFVRVLAGGGISLTVGIAAALISVFIGTLYGAVSGYVGGKVDAVMMRIVDILYGLPYVLLVVLLAVASEAVVEEWQSNQHAQVAWVKARAKELARADGAAAFVPEADSRSEEIEAFRNVDVAALMTGVPEIQARLETWRQAALEKSYARQRERWERAKAKFDRDQKRVQRGAEPCFADPGPPPEPPLANQGAVETAAASGTLGEFLARTSEMQIGNRELDEWQRSGLDLLTLLFAIGAVSWLTLARVVRGQVLSLKSQPFVEAARALGSPGRRIFFRHLLPNLVGPIVVYATLTVPQAILQESFLSFLGIGVRPPMPSWGNLAADGLLQLNTYRSYWWLLLFPCVLLGTTLLALNFVGEGLREAFDPKRSRR